MKPKQNLKLTESKLGKIQNGSLNILPLEGKHPIRDMDTNLIIKKLEAEIDKRKSLLTDSLLK